MTFVQNYNNNSKIPFTYPINTSFSYKESVSLDNILIQDNIKEIYNFDNPNNVNLNDLHNLNYDNTEHLKDIGLLINKNTHKLKSDIQHFFDIEKQYNFDEIIENNYENNDNNIYESFKLKEGASFASAVTKVKNANKFKLPGGGGFKLPDGGFKLPDGGIRLPDGGIRLPDGGIRLPDGGVRLPDDGIRLPDGGGVRLPDGGGARLPDGGGARLPDGGNAPDAPNDFKLPDRNPSDVPDAPDDFKMPDDSKTPDTLNNPDNPDLNNPGLNNPDNPDLNNPDLNNPNNPDLNNPNNPDLNNPNNPDLNNPDNPDLNKPDNPDLNKPDNPDLNNPDNPNIDVDGQPTDAQIMALRRQKRQNFDQVYDDFKNINSEIKTNMINNEAHLEAKYDGDISLDKSTKTILGRMRQGAKDAVAKAYRNVLGNVKSMPGLMGKYAKMSGKFGARKTKQFFSWMADICSRNPKNCALTILGIAGATALGIYIKANNNYEKCKRVENEAKEYNVKCDNLKCEEEYNEQAIEECKKKIEKKKNLKSSPNNKENVASESNLLKCDDDKACGIQGLTDEKCDEKNNCQNYVMAIDDTKNDCIELEDDKKMDDILKELNNAGIYPGPLWIKDPDTNELSGPKWTGGKNWDTNDDYSKQLFDKYIANKEHCWVKIADVITTTDYETGETTTEIVEPTICNEICRKIFDNNIDLKMGEAAIDFLAHIAKEFGYIIQRIVGGIILYFVLYIGYYIFIGSRNMYNYPYKRY
jgi:hypothetical protein